MTGENYYLRPGIIFLRPNPDKVVLASAYHSVLVTGIDLCNSLEAMFSDPSKPISPVDAGDSIDALAFNLLESNHCLVQGDHLPIDSQQEIASFFSSIGIGTARSVDRLQKSVTRIIAPSEYLAEIDAILKSNSLAFCTVGVASGCELDSVFREIGTTPTAFDRTVVVGFPYKLPVARLIHQYLFSQGQPILFASFEGMTARLGPYVLPGSTPCLECLISRWISNAGSGELEALANIEACFDRKVPASLYSLPAFRTQAFGHLAVELARICVGIPPTTVGRVIETSFVDGAVSSRNLLLAPRCRCCSKQRPWRLAWDIVEPRIPVLE